MENELELIKRHIHVFKILKEKQPLGINKLSEITKYPKHMIRYSLRILEQDKLIKPSSKGAITSKESSEVMKLFKKSLDKIGRTIEEIKREN
ncbi:hypothetical protein AYK24_05315 [Thermoplasmatales archaeon SG8-52-4]|nr:MAG: hypothetical protein AYK24_05315 [Thermoplasmatales archaeon SG8-52-4]